MQNGISERIARLETADAIALRKAEQGENLFARLQASAMAARVQAQRLLEQTADLTITEWRILWDLSEVGPLSVRDMAAIQRTDHSLISRALPAMRDKGYVQQLQNPRDKRQSMIALTEAGTRAFARAAPTMQRRRARLAEALPPADQKQMLDLLDRFDAFLDTPPDAFTSQDEPL